MLKQKKTTKKSNRPQVIFQPDCHTCNALCCRSLSLPLKKPRTKKDFDTIRWILLHEGMWVGIDQNDTWLAEIPIACKHIDKENRCAIYKKRPGICEDFPSQGHSCEHQSGHSPFKVIIKNESQLNRYIKRAAMKQGT